MAPETDAPAMRLHFPISFKVRHADTRTVAWALRTYTTWREHSYLLNTSARAPARATACTQNACTSRWAARPHGHTHTQRVPAHEHKTGRRGRRNGRRGHSGSTHTRNAPSTLTPLALPLRAARRKRREGGFRPYTVARPSHAILPTARMYDDPRLHLSRQRPVDMTAQMPL